MKASLSSACSLAVVFVLGCCGISNVQASTLFDSITGSDFVAADSVGGIGPLYASFSTGSNAETLSEVRLMLAATDPNGGGIFNISLWSDNGAPFPGSLIANLGSFSDSVLTTNFSSFTVTGSSPLDANTRYWIEVAGVTSAQWGYTYNTSGIGVLSEFWVTNLSSGVAVPNSGNVDWFAAPYQMSVQGELSTVPLPAALPLFVTALLGGGVVAWRKKRKQKTEALAG